jgi:lipid-A-disaccharide synthase
MDRLKPTLVILIDFPDFNLNIVARAAKKRGIRVFYYISPQVWAWREGRVKQIKKLVDKMAVILPFEVDFYASHGYTVQYVGHPLVDKVKTSFTQAAARLEFGLPATRTTIGLLPGSRTAEVSRLLPEMMKAAQKISAQIPQVQYILPLADTLNKDRVAGIINPSGMDVKIVSGRTYDALAACDLAIVTSGTATLEAGLLGVPMVIIYKMSVLSALIGKLIINPKYIGLVNIIAGESVAPELIQLKATGGRIAAEALSILSNRDRKLAMISELKNIRQKLGDPGAARKAAQIACDMI